MVDRCRITNSTYGSVYNLETFTHMDNEGNPSRFRTAICMVDSTRFRIFSTNENTSWAKYNATEKIVILKQLTHSTNTFFILKTFFVMPNYFAKRFFMRSSKYTWKYTDLRMYTKLIRDILDFQVQNKQFVFLKE